MTYTLIDNIANIKTMSQEKKTDKRYDKNNNKDAM